MATYAGALVLVGLVAGGLLLFRGEGQERLSKPAYEHRVRAVYADVQAAFEATRGTSGSTLAARVATAQSRLREAADRLQGGEPPKVVEEENEELAQGMEAYAKDLDVLHAAIGRADAAAVERFDEELDENDAIEQMAEAAEEMKFKGFDLGRLAEE